MTTTKQKNQTPGWFDAIFGVFVVLGYVTAIAAGIYFLAFLPSQREAETQRQSAYGQCLERIEGDSKSRVVDGGIVSLKCNEDGTTSEAFRSWDEIQSESIDDGAGGCTAPRCS